MQVEPGHEFRARQRACLSNALRRFLTIVDRLEVKVPRDDSVRVESASYDGQHDALHLCPRNRRLFSLALPNKCPEPDVVVFAFADEALQQAILERVHRWTRWRRSSKSLITISD